MKKTYKYLLSLLLLVLLSGETYSLLSLSLGPVIGYTIPSSDLSGSTGDYYNGTKYGVSGGIDFGAMGNLGLGPINLHLNLIYSPLSNSGTADETKSNSTVNVKMHLLTIAVGTQYSIGIPLAPIKPYAGLDILFTTFSGSFQFQGTPNVNSDTHDMNSSSRVGLGINAGVQIKLLTFAIDASIHYNMLNLFSKRYEGTDSQNRLDSYLYLNDDKDPNYTTSTDKHPIAGSRTISTIQFQLGVLFGL